MSCGGKSHKKHTAHDSDPHRQRRQQLLGPLGRRRPQAADHIVVEQGDRREYENRDERVGEVDELELVLGGDLRRQRGGSVDNPEALEGGEAVADGPLLVLDAVGEAEQQARECAERHERRRHGSPDGVAVALVGEYGREELEAEGGAGGEEVGQAGGAVECLADGVLDQVSVYFW